MKYPSLVTLILFLNGTLFSQADSLESNKWSATVHAGVIFPFGMDSYKNSANAGFEIVYSYTPYTAIFLSGTYYLLSNKDHAFSDPFYNESSSILETTIGGKFYLNPYHDNVFIEVGTGYYQTYKYISYESYHHPEYIDELGFSAGIGDEVKINKNLDISLKIKLHLVNLISGGDLKAFWVLYPGIKYIF